MSAPELASPRKLIHSLVDPEAVALQYSVEQFLYREADLLDTWRWRDWLDLFTDDMRYFMPVRKNRLRRQRGESEFTSGTHMAHFDDSKRSMMVRVGQMESGRHWAEDPPSRCRHLFSNVRIDESVGDVHEFGVQSNFLCYRNRLESEVDIWAGERHDILRVSDEGEFRIASRAILLDQNVILSKNLSVFF
ncbi:3-phenylpropionate/cinnamic acid dioxygenase subunit beta [Saccharomonospora sp. NPDC046836]|uniref:aromatic-ring-hydroxylating dioxygenase subunit beta n=1 Tax=Saccharomonospora sp. NPDC046836 TaxID=3156921 RepID=UPI0033CF34BD